MKKHLFLFAFLLSLSFIGCKSDTKEKSVNPETIKVGKVSYATAFDILEFDGYKEIILKDLWPNSQTSLRYLLVEDKDKAPENTQAYDAVVQVPIKTIVVTSTTHIPSLDMLGETQTLIGFPDLDFISSTSARSLIDQGKVIGLGKNEVIDVERVLELNPEVLVSFAVDGLDPKLKTIAKAGIPVLYNSDWVETSPLGKAEWIKFFGALYGKYDLATELFEEVEKEYLNIKELAEQATYRPTVFSGAMYKDVWFVPQGESWAAQFIADAQGEYLWKDTKGTGSNPLGLESVLEKAHLADVWLDPSAFISKESLAKANKVYSQFEAFKTDNIYTYVLKKGATGGVIYFELGPNRPDIILKDILYILHPELLPDYTPYFYSKIED